jgi:hypothetical protein
MEQINEEPMLIITKEIRKAFDGWTECNKLHNRLLKQWLKLTKNLPNIEQSELASHILTQLRGAEAIEDKYFYTLIALLEKQRKDK